MDMHNRLKHRLIDYDTFLRTEFGIKIFAYDLDKYRYFINVLRRTEKNINLPLIADSAFSYVDDENFYIIDKYNILCNHMTERCTLDFTMKVNYQSYPCENRCVKNEIYTVDEIMHAHDITLKKCVIITDKHYSTKLLTGINLVNCFFILKNNRNMQLYYLNERRKYGY